MRPICLLASLAALLALAACGTKTPLTLPSPPPATPVAVSPTPTFSPTDDSNKAGRDAK